MNLSETLAACKVLPVLNPLDVNATLNTVAALREGGMDCIELTLRREISLDCLAAVKGAWPDLVLGAGTMTGVDQLAAVARIGVDFCVSPGISGELLAAARQRGMPFLPGVASPSDVMLGLAHGLTLFKLFPAAAVGGIPMLSAMQGPFPEVRFCPTGGLTADNYRRYLELPNVLCCGGSWMVTERLMREQRWEEIQRLANDTQVNTDEPG